MELDGEIRPQDAGRLAEHIEVCASCAKEREEMLALEQDLVRLPVESAPASLVREVVESIEQERDARHWVEPVIVGASVVGGATAAVFGVIRATDTERPRGLWQMLQGVPQWLSDRVAVLAEKMPGIESVELEPGTALAVTIVSVVVVALVAVAILRVARDSSKHLRKSECR